jgi:hypothetical protein
VSDLGFFSKNFLLLKCYNISKYACVSSGNYKNVVRNDTIIRLGPGVRYETVEDDNSIPTAYFSFCDHEDLSARCGNDELLTGKLKDYLKTTAILIRS